MFYVNNAELEKIKVRILWCPKRVFGVKTDENEVKMVLRDENIWKRYCCFNFFCTFAFES